MDYIVFSPIVEDGWETVLQEAKEADIPVIVMDRNVSCDPSLYTAWVGSDFTEEGRNAARWLEEDLKGKKFDRGTARDFQCICNVRAHKRVCRDCKDASELGNSGFR